MGNYFGKLKTNGLWFRTPWTLSNEEVGAKRIA
jgi:hypothetical protein